MPHAPVLLDESIDYLNPAPGKNFIDATIGNGGHTTALLKKIQPGGKVLGVDWSEDAIMQMKNKFQHELKNGRLALTHGNFRDIKNLAGRMHFKKISGAIFDLGVSTEELEGSGRGFSFKKDEPLKMTYGNVGVRNVDATEVVNSLSQEELENMFSEYGEERYARRAARAIVEARRQKSILTSKELADIVERVLPRSYERGRIHPATRIFQAIRIYVNDELGNLEHGLLDAFELVEPGGRVVVIAYHSLEDRIIKRQFRSFVESGMGKLLTKKPVQPSRQEVERNPRSRSAKLRAVEKL